MTGKMYTSYTVRELREMLWEAEAVPRRWMLSYIKKQEAVDLMSALDTTSETETIVLPDDYQQALKARQDSHVKKAQRAKKNREEQFGVSATTHRERLRIIHESAAPLLYTGKAFFEDGFTSAAGSVRGKMALKFQTDQEDDVYLFTRAEAQILQEWGVEVPSGALHYSKDKATITHRLGGKTLKDVFS